MRLHNSAIARLTKLSMVWAVFAASIVGCESSSNKAKIDPSLLESTIESQTRKWAEHYFNLYAERNDWDAFLSCYSKDVEFKDQRIDIQLSGRMAFAEFYNWKDSRFKKIKGHELILNVDELVIQSRLAVARGTFSPFQWDGQRMDWTDDFVIWLEFNADGKIISQRDFIPYPKSLLPDDK